LAFCFAYSLIPVQPGRKSILTICTSMHQGNDIIDHWRPCPIDFTRSSVTVTETVADLQYPDGHHLFTLLGAVFY